jgi:hypothetical protein
MNGDLGCQIQFWQETTQELSQPTLNLIGQEVLW